MRWTYFAITILLIVNISGVAYLLLASNHVEKVKLEEYKAKFNQNTPPISSQFYENMRYPRIPVTYSIAETCSIQKKEAFIEATKRLEALTLIEFKESIQEANIEITCSNIVPIPDQEDHFIAGEGGPTLVLKSTLFAIITKGQIAFYRQETCDQSQIATHEILHALGFDHNSNEKSIMYPITSCDQEIDEYIIKEINRLYSQKTQSDIFIEQIDSSKSGNYIDLEILITNQGLKKSMGSELTIRSAERIIQTFTIEEIDIGAKRKLTITNLKLPRQTEKIDFELATNEQELNKTNNNAFINTGE